MASTVTRRPVPALVALLALLLLTALVWWRVLHRSTGAAPQAGGTCTSSSASSSPSPSPTPAQTVLPAPETVTVLVLNATKRPGIAGDARTVLIRDGFRSPHAAGNDVKHRGKVKAVAQIRYRPSVRADAQLLRYYFPGADLVTVHTKRTTITVSLGKKYKHVTPPRQVRAAMRTDSVAVSSAPDQPQPSPSSC
jgi:hypothetical protein